MIAFVAVVENTSLPMRKAPSLTLIVLPLTSATRPAGDIEELPSLLW